MKIAESNIDLFNTIDVMHDKIIKQFIYDYKTHTLKLLFMDDVDIKIFYSIDFYNVIGLEMNSCDLWGYSPHVDYFCYIEHAERKLIPKLRYEKSQTTTSPHCIFDSNKMYLEMVMAFVSGNIITIACESIEFYKYQ